MPGHYFFVNETERDYLSAKVYLDKSVMIKNQRPGEPLEAVFLTAKQFEELIAKYQKLP